MVQDDYGGTVALMHYLITGKLEDRMVTYPAQHAAKPVPQHRFRIVEIEQKRNKRNRYYANVIKRIDGQGSLPSDTPWVHWHVKERRKWHQRGWVDYEAKRHENDPSCSSRT